MPKRHVIDIEEFNEYQIKNEIASASVHDRVGVKTLTAVTVLLDNRVYYRVDSPKGTSGHDTLDKAVMAYNEI